MPAAFAALQADYATWAQANGVLPMPEGYNPVKQVLINTFVNYWIPTYWPLGLALLLMGLLAAVALRARRRRAAA
jgi:arylsulfatase/uncharacterized sulfatase